MSARRRLRTALRRFVGRALVCAVLWALSFALAHASVELNAAGALLSPAGLSLGSLALAGLFVLTRIGAGVAVLVTLGLLPLELLRALWPLPETPPEPRPLEEWREVEPLEPAEFEPPPDVAAEPNDPWRDVPGPPPAEPDETDEPRSSAPVELEEWRAHEPPEPTEPAEVSAEPLAAWKRVPKPPAAPPRRSKPPSRRVWGEEQE